MKAKAVFLDRDGVINEVKTDRVKFVNRPQDFHLLEGVPEAIAMLRKQGYKIFVVTNQGGIGLGYMKKQTLHEIHEKMQQDLIAADPDAIIDDIAYCPHKPTGGCPCRKPRPGMILELAQKHSIDLSRSWMVGDMESDIEAGKKAGCQTALISREYSLLDFARELRKTTEGDKRVRCKNCQREMSQGYVLIHHDDDGTIEMYFCGRKECLDEMQKYEDCSVAIYKEGEPPLVIGYLGPEGGDENTMIFYPERRMSEA